MRKAVLASAAVASLGLALVGCSSGGGDTAKAFCDEVSNYKDTYVMQLTAAQYDDHLIDSGDGALSDLRGMWAAWLEVAPDELRSDVEDVKNSWDYYEDGLTVEEVTNVAGAISDDSTMVNVARYIRETCSSSYAAATDDTRAEEEPDAEPAEAAGPLLTDTWTDDDGYSYEFSVLTAEGTASKDVANAKPGEANLTWSYTITGEVTNTTPERNAPMPSLRVEPVWPASSPVCSLGWLLIQPAFNSNTDGREEAWCTLGNAPWQPLTDGNQIMMNETVAVNASVSNPIEVPAPEADADAIIAELQAPPMWAIARNTGENLLTDCLLSSGGYYLSVATGDTGCTP